MRNTPITDNISGERTETAEESAAEGVEFFTEVTPEMVTEGEGNASENAFHPEEERRQLSLSVKSQSPNWKPWGDG